MIPLKHKPTAALETSAVEKILADNCFTSNAKSANEVIFKSNEADNILFADKRKNKNNDKLKRRLQNLMSAVFTTVVAFSFSFTACIASEQPPGDTGKLPSGVFPLDSTKWVEVEEYSTRMESVLDSEGIYLYDVSTFYSDTIVYFVRKIEENKAELYSSIKTGTITTFIYPDGGGVSTLDSHYISQDVELNGWIRIEGKKVYLQEPNYNFDEGYRMLLCDFSQNIGDTFYVGADFEIYNKKYNEPFILTKIDSIALLGSEYRKIYTYFRNPDDIYQGGFSVIEGMGHVILSSFHYWLAMKQMYTSHTRHILLAVYYKDRKIFDYNDFWNINKGE